MNIFYDDKTDLLYIRLVNTRQDVTNKRISEDIVLDIGNDEKLIGIEIVDASRHVHLEQLFPVTYADPLLSAHELQVIREDSQKLG
jgi:uncharacterized protein YuzE